MQYKSESVEEEERKAAIEHRDMLLDLRFILGTEAGQRFFKYLFRNFDVAQMPEQGLEGITLHERMGFMRAGNALFKIASEANFEVAANILAHIEKERYDQIYADSKIGQN